MAHLVHCVKLGKETEGLDFPPDRRMGDRKQDLLKEELEKFFFGEGSAPPAEFVAE